MAKVFYTPEISLPTAIKFGDCHPVVVTPNDAIAHAYIIEGYPVRSAWDVFAKGPTPPPFYFETSLNGNTAYYSIYFNNFNQLNCPEFSCNLQCATQDVSIVRQSGSSASFSYCANGEKPRYFFTAEFASDSIRESLPATFNFTFSDQLLNANEVTVNSISFVKPLSPPVLLTTVDNKDLIYVGVPFKTVSHYDLNQEDIECFMIQKSHNSLSGPETFISWANGNESEGFHDGVFKDNLVVTGNTYNYRLKYRNKYKEETQWSDWISVSMTGALLTSFVWTT